MKWILFLFLIPGLAQAIVATRPNTYIAGDVILSSEVNDDFDTIYSVVNGQLDTDNISSRGIASTDMALLSIETGLLADGAVTRAKQYSYTYVESSEFTSTSTAASYSNEQDVSIVVSGLRPVMVGLTNDSSNTGFVRVDVNAGSPTDLNCFIRLQRDGTTISTQKIQIDDTTNLDDGVAVPAASFFTLDFPSSSGQVSYRVQIQSGDTNVICSLNALKLYALEL